MDYCLPGDEHGERLTVLVIKVYTKVKKAVVVPNKGSTGSYAAGTVNELIHECGDRDMIVKKRPGTRDPIPSRRCLCCSDRTNPQGGGPEVQQGIERHR